MTLYVCILLTHNYHHQLTLNDGHCVVTVRKQHSVDILKGKWNPIADVKAFLFVSNQSSQHCLCSVGFFLTVCEGGWRGGGIANFLITYVKIMPMIKTNCLYILSTYCLCAAFSFDPTICNDCSAIYSVCLPFRNSAGKCCRVS